MNKKSCNNCKYREYDVYGWQCNRHGTYTDISSHDDIDKLEEMNHTKCKYYKRDKNYINCKGVLKYFICNSNHYYYDRGKFKKEKLNWDKAFL